MPNIIKIKISLDITMTIFMVLAMAYQVTGIFVHEIVGALLFVMFFAHNYLNRCWYSSLFQKNNNVATVINKMINITLCFIMLVLFVSSVAMYQSISLKHSMFVRQLHIQMAYLSYIFLSIHIGMHWEMLMGILKKVVTINRQSAAHFLMVTLLPIFIFLYGTKVSFDLQVAAKIFCPSPFSIARVNEEAFIVIFNLITLMGMYIFAVNLTLKKLRKLKNLQRGTVDEKTN